MAVVLALASPASASGPGRSECGAYQRMHVYTTGNRVMAERLGRACRIKVLKHELHHPLPASMIPDTLERIRDCESGLRDRNGGPIRGSHRYRMEHGGDRGGYSDASGAYMYLDSTWGRVAVRGVGVWTHAADAPPRVQDERAVRNFRETQHVRGVLGDPWYESRGCWG